ncbi:MAG: radical SAM protein [Polyangiaceae bacterium]|nr:radical SAM protein [Polyangiaceae bacterium]
MNPPPDPAARALFEAHPRTFESNRYVYPVVSRRSGGISIGVNLNLDKVCNFDCVYCQVDRTELGTREFVETDRLATELDAAVRLITSGAIFETPKFQHTPAAFRRLNDIAFSGDGEPTTYRNFDEIVAASAEVRRRHGLGDVKLVLITNASMFHRERVRRALELLDANNGEIWAKLDAGTEEYYRRIIRTVIPFERILDNLREAASVRPIVIQSLFMRVAGEPPSLEEQHAYCDRLSEIVAGGGRIKLVQVHTVARPPAESWVASLTNAEADALADLVRHRTGLPVAAFYGMP